MRCAVNNCGNNNRQGNRKKCRYFHFPKKEAQLRKWIDFCERVALNPSTACICNEHFAPNDFERNMQYELGFSRKNPTKLKPGSFPTINRPQELAQEKKRRRRKTKKDEVDPPTDVELGIGGKSPVFQEQSQSTKIELCELVSENEEFEESYNDTVELISESGKDSEPFESADSPKEHQHTLLKLEIVDPLNPATNAKDYVEIIDSEGDSYVKHLEHEVCSLKREVFALRDERQKLMDEIQALKSTIHSSQLRKKAVEQLQLKVRSSKVWDFKNT
ncbi:hypothetical protein KR009_011147 [Drosophila setifemur]|nr:hypothetical protein KR009_011147 [Drosophila setifemur]